MRPFHNPHPNAAQPQYPRPGDPGPPPLHALPMHPQMNPAAFPPPGPGFAAANPMAAVAAANPFLAMQLFGQAQQLQNLGYLAAAAIQQQQQQQQHQQQPFFAGGNGFRPNLNQFGAFPGPPAGFNGGEAFQPGGAAVDGSRPPRPMMGAAGSGFNSSGFGASAPRPMMNDRNGGSGWGGEVNHTKNKSDGISHFASENGESNYTTDQKAQFNPGRDARDGTQFSPSGGRGRGPGRDVRQFSPSGGRGRDGGRDGRQFGPSGGRGRGDGSSGRSFGPSGGNGRGDGRDGRQFVPSGGRGRGDGRDGRQFGRGRGAGRSFNQGRGKGSNDWSEVKSNFACSDSPASEGRRKRPPIHYDMNEVKQWLQARKKNYPTSVNINKKLSQIQSDDQKKDEEAQKRRQELKEVLAKQKELGFELPELPPGYLSETEDQAKGTKSNWKTQNRDCRFGNSNNKRQRYDRRDLQSKRSRVRNQNHTRRDDGAIVKPREPTLLQKLLSSDIKRDRHRLLHTFKFMVLNNFFRDCPDKPLEYPSVKVNQIELESDIAVEDLDDLQSDETTKGISLDSKENGDPKEDSSSSDEEAGIKDSSENDGDDDNVGHEDADAEQCNASDEEFSA